jgi:hypothetical protein
MDLSIFQIGQNHSIFLGVNFKIFSDLKANSADHDQMAHLLAGLDLHWLHG